MREGARQRRRVAQDYPLHREPHGIGPAQTMDVHIEVHDTIADSEIKDGNKKPNKCSNSSTHFGGVLSPEIPFLSHNIIKVFRSKFHLLSSTTATVTFSAFSLN